MKEEYLQELRCCQLCEHRCQVNRLDGELGVCRMGIPEVASRMLHRAPPASYTIFTAGCNFKCLNCQNWTISQFPDNGIIVDGYIEPERLARECMKKLDLPEASAIGADRIFFSGGEPTIHLPFIEEVVREARRVRPTMKVNFDTNGFMTRESLQRVLGFTTSITYDLKAYYDETHRAITGAPVGPVLRNAEIIAAEAPGKLWDFRIVVIPQINERDIKPLCQFVAGISRSLPVCFLAFRPNYILEDHFGASRGLMNFCLKEAKDARLSNASWSGVASISGRGGSINEDMVSVYASDGPALAASYAFARRCKTHPRDCRNCKAHSKCPLKKYIPRRSC